MGARTRPWSSLLTVALLVAAMTGPTNAQAEVNEETPAPSPTAGPGLAEVALCQMPELGERAGSLGPLVASIAGVAAPGPRSAQGLGTLMPTGSAGCMLPSVEVPDPLDPGNPIPMYALNDLVGDGPVDIRRVLSTTRELSGAEARARRSQRGTVIAGKPARAIPVGGVYLICVELEAPLEPGDSVVVGTDVKGDATKRSPSGVEGPDNALSNLRDLYHLAVQEDGSLFAASTDLATSTYYTGKRPFAAWTVGTSAYFMIPRDGLGDDFRAVTFRPGKTSDSTGLGAQPGLIPSGGRADWIDECILQLLVHEPLELEDAFFPSHDEVTFCFGASVDDIERLEDWLDEGSEDVARGLIRFTLYEKGRSDPQERPLEVWIGDDDRIYFSFLIGLSAYEFHAITDVEIQPTGSDALDDMFDEAARDIGRRMNPTFFGEKPGALQGSDCPGARPRPL
jgi:hypothetical protein